MSFLKGEKILLGITAGIAAYKTANLLRLFIKSGADVQVIMTPEAKNFVTPLTLSTLSKRTVYSSFFDDKDENKLWNNHVELGLWADIMLVAPATANTLSKMKNGNADNLLLATYMSAKCPVYFAPAMDLDMYKHPSTSKNISALQGFGNILIPAKIGELASGLFGKGRMAEPEEIITFIENDISNKLNLKGKKVLITAGPTHEKIDPVRFIGNHSSGKMGFELAKTAANLGAEVILISGPSHQQISHPAVKRIDVVSAEEMYDAVHKYYKNTNIAIAAAAVADYTTISKTDKKIKKKNDFLEIKLKATKDILASMGVLKKEQFLVGFALETNNELENAKEKLKCKNLDMIVLNSLKDKGAGFAVDTNKITIVNADNKIKKYKLESKDTVASNIFTEILKMIND